MTAFKIALLQMTPVEEQITKNIKIADEYCREAASKGAHLAIFPEMFSIGYPTPYCTFDDPMKHWREVSFQGKDPDPEGIVAKYRDYAIDDHHEYVEHFRELAKELDMAIAVTYMSKGRSFPRNTVLVIDRFGRDVIKYSKIHLFAPFIIDALCEPGDEFFVKEIDTPVGIIKLGALICADRDIPDPAQTLMKLGAELVIIPNSCPLEEGFGERITALVRARAFENAMAIAICNYPSPKNDGHSAVFNADGSEMFRADAKEGVMLVDIDLKQIREYRRITTMGAAFREEGRFQLPPEMPIPEPFQGRRNALGERPGQYGHSLE